MPHRSRYELQASVCVVRQNHTDDHQIFTRPMFNPALRTQLIVLITATVLTCSSAHAQTEPTLDSEGIPGTLILVGGGEVPEGTTELLEKNLAGASILILADASAEPREAIESARHWLSDASIRRVLVQM